MPHCFLYHFLMLPKPKVAFFFPIVFCYFAVFVSGVFFLP